MTAYLQFLLFVKCLCTFFLMHCNLYRGFLIHFVLYFLSRPALKVPIAVPLQYSLMHGSNLKLTMWLYTGIWLCPSQVPENQILDQLNIEPDV